MIYGLGMLEMGITMSMAQLVIDNEFAGMIKRVLQGIPVNDKHLAAEVIRKVGAHGHFLTQEHTIEFLRECNSQPQIIDRTMRDVWIGKGSKNMTVRAEEKARFLLETHKPIGLPDNVLENVRLLRIEREKEMGIKIKETV